MNMRISGKGNIPAGEYEKVSISGHGRLFGRVRCGSFSASGFSKGEEIECGEEFKVSGTSLFSKNITAKSIRASGTFACDGGIAVRETLSCSGSAKCKRSIKCEHLSMSGTLTVDGDIEAESIKAAGAVNCEGLINAENIEIKADKIMNIGSIGGSNIVIKRKRFSVVPNRRVIVASSIEGDNIAVERVTCPRITGRVVVIGKGCKVDLVQYSEEIKLSPDARVGKVEKL